MSTCGAANFDTRMAVYFDAGICPPTAALVAGCSDNAGGCAGDTSEVVIEVVGGVDYLIRLGGATSADVGTGTLTITCDGGMKPDPCPADLTDDGSVGPADLANLLSVWGTDDEAADFDDDGVVGPADLATLLSAWGDCPA